MNVFHEIERLKERVRELESRLAHTEKVLSQLGRPVPGDNRSPDWP